MNLNSIIYNGLYNFFGKLKDTHILKFDNKSIDFGKKTKTAKGEGESVPFHVFLYLLSKTIYSRRSKYDKEFEKEYIDFDIFETISNPLKIGFKDFNDILKSKNLETLKDLEIFPHERSNIIYTDKSYSSSYPLPTGVGTYKKFFEEFFGNLSNCYGGKLFESTYKGEKVDYYFDRGTLLTRDEVGFITLGEFMYNGLEKKNLPKRIYFEIEEGTTEEPSYSKLYSTLTQNEQNIRDFESGLDNYSLIYYFFKVRDPDINDEYHIINCPLSLTHTNFLSGLEILEWGIEFINLEGLVANSLKYFSFENLSFNIYTDIIFSDNKFKNFWNSLQKYLIPELVLRNIEVKLKNYKTYKNSYKNFLDFQISDFVKVRESFKDELIEDSNKMSNLLKTILNENSSLKGRFLDFMYSEEEEEKVESGYSTFYF